MTLFVCVLAQWIIMLHKCIYGSLWELQVKYSYKTSSWAKLECRHVHVHNKHFLFVNVSLYFVFFPLSFHLDLWSVQQAIINKLPRRQVSNLMLLTNRKLTVTCSTFSCNTKIIIGGVLMHQHCLHDWLTLDLKSKSIYMFYALFYFISKDSQYIFGPPT